MKKYYAVYVADDAGWYEGCPSFEVVFFGDDHPGQYVDPSGDMLLYSPGDYGVCGAVIVQGFRAARDLRERLEASDWCNPDTGVEQRPRYAIRAIQPTWRVVIVDADDIVVETIPGLTERAAAKELLRTCALLDPAVSRAYVEMEI